MEAFRARRVAQRFDFWWMMPHAEWQDEPGTIAGKLPYASIPRIFVSGALLFGVVLAVMVAWLLHYTFDRVEIHTANETQNLSNVLVQIIEGAIDKIDLSLLTAKDEIERLHASGMREPAALTAFLGRLQDRTPIADALRTTDTNGNAVYGRDIPLGSPVSLADRDYFVYLRDHPDAGLFISEPTLGRITKEWGLLFARRLSDETGAFAGVVFCRVNLSTFQRLFAGIKLGERGAANLRDAAGGFITGALPDEDIGKMVGSRNVSPEFRRRLDAGEASGHFYTPAGFDGVPRIVAFGKVGKYPLYVSVGVASDEYLKEWKREAVAMVGFVALFTLLATSAALHAGRSMQRRIKAREALYRQEERARAISELAYHDTLTGLPNRRLLLDRLAQALAASNRSRRYGALLFLDLDNFKSLNDRYGHVVGDLLLVEVASRLVACVREMDTVARFGGDEFVVMIPELATDRRESLEEGTVIGGKILEALAKPYALPLRQDWQAAEIIMHHCSASLGAALFFAHDLGSEDIVKNADAAMYQAKRAGRGQMRFAGPDH